MFPNVTYSVLMSANVTNVNGSEVWIRVRLSGKDAESFENRRAESFRTRPEEALYLLTRAMKQEEGRKRDHDNV